jgi:hypothetical protein
VETATIPVTVNAVTVNTGFTLTGPAITIASPGSTGTSTITITPSGGFTGSVALACSVTSSPAGAVDPPTCSAGQPSAISGGTAVTATLTVNTTGSSTAALHNPLDRFLTLGGGGTLAAAVLLFGLPRRRKKWQALLSLVVLSLIAATAAIGCGGTPAVTTSGGTSAGTYVVTVTGTSGGMAAKTTVSVTVQ